MKRKVKEITLLLFLLLSLINCKTKQDIKSDQFNIWVRPKLRIQNLEKIIKELKNNLEAKNDELNQLIKQDNLEKEKINEMEKEKKFIENNLTKITTEYNQLKEQIKQEKHKTEELYNDLTLKLKNEINSNNINIIFYEGIIIIQIKNQVLFDAQIADIKTEYESTLLTIAQIFKKIPEKIIRIEGHTATGSNPYYPTSWELGAARATNIVRFFQEKAGINPERLVAVSFGEYRPLYSNNTPEGKAKNRRVEIILLDRPIYQIDELIKTK